MNERPDEVGEEKLAEGTLISHLIDLRARVFKAVLAILAVFVCLLPFTQDVFLFLSQPVREQLPEGSTLIATGVAAPFLVPFKATFYAAVFIAMPFVLYQMWRFIAPGLYRHEKRFAVPLLISSIVLFYLGVAFAYVLVMKLAFGFFVSVTPEGIAATPDISLYLSFALGLLLAFGVAFQVPVATFIIVAIGLVSREDLGRARPYVFLGAFVAGAFLSPPEPLSQVLLAVPMYLLYEFGLVLSRLLLPARHVEAEQV